MYLPVNFADFSAPTVNWAARLRSAASWLDTLPKLASVMACNDECGRWLIDACRRAGLGVPDSVGIVGAELDEQLRARRAAESEHTHRCNNRQNAPPAD